MSGAAQRVKQYMDISEGRLLNGRVRYDQPRVGFRTGIEPVLLAASIPANPGETVLEAGTGAGAAMLCLAARVPDCRITAVERDPQMAALAVANLRANGFAQTVVMGDVLHAKFPGEFDHAMANPPWHDPNSSASPVARRDAAKRAEAGLYEAWARTLAARLRPKGTLTFILPAARLAAGIEAMAAASCGTVTIAPLWPRLGKEAKIVLLRGIRHGAGPCRLTAGLILHGVESRYTDEAEAILSGGQAFVL